MTDTEEKVTQILSRVLGLKVNETVSSQTSSEWDSLAHLQIIVEVESEFDIKFLSLEIPDLTSCKNLVEAIERIKIAS